MTNSKIQMLSIVKRLAYYFRIWLMMSRNSFITYLQSRAGAAIFLFAKTIRFFFFLGFLFYILKNTGNLAGYSLNQALFFFITFNVVDVFAQFLFREVYRFRPLIISGSFDLVLVKPINALFRSLMGGADLYDLITLPPLIFTVFYLGGQLNPSLLHTAYYILLLLNGLLIAAAFHIAVISLGIITLEIDNSIMIYRDIVSLGRLPIDIYKEPLRGMLTYLIPVGIMISFPAKALMGLMTTTGIFLSFILGGVLIFSSLRFWNYALKQYTSASS